MQVVDANVLLYAVNADAPRHDAARRWLDEALSGAEAVGFAWVVLLAFVRLATNAAVFPRPLPTEAALDVVDAWLAQPAARIVEPTARHLALVRGLLEPIGTNANLVNDAHLAAIALEHGASLVTFDNDFERFSGIRRIEP